MPKVTCPVCEHSEAEDVTDGGYDGKQIRCPHCGRYDVAGSALAMLGDRTREHREAALAKAKAFSRGPVPMIDTRCF